MAAWSFRKRPTKAVKCSCGTMPKCQNNAMGGIGEIVAKCCVCSENICKSCLVMEPENKGDKAYCPKHSSKVLGTQVSTK